jgi:hypothetical protein
MIKQYGGKDKYIKMLKSKLAKLESTELEEAKRMKYDKVIKKLRDGEWDTSMDVKKRMHLTYIDNNTGKEKVVFVESNDLEEGKSVKIKTRTGSHKYDYDELLPEVQKIVIMSKAVAKKNRMDVAKKITKAIIAGKIKNADISSDLATLIGINQPYAGHAPRGVVKGQLKKLKLESAEIEEAIKWWTVTITRNIGRLTKKGDSVETKARNSAEAIKKGLKKMNFANPKLVPSNAVDAKLSKNQMSTVESSEVKEASELTEAKISIAKFKPGIVATPVWKGRGAKNFGIVGKSVYGGKVKILGLGIVPLRKKAEKKHVLGRDYKDVQSKYSDIWKSDDIRYGNFWNARDKQKKFFRAISDSDKKIAPGFVCWIWKVIDGPDKGLIDYCFIDSDDRWSITYLNKSAEFDMETNPDLKESTGLEEANNRLKAHTPAAAQRLIKKLKNKFSGYTWDQRIKGDEVIYPMEPHIIRFIKKQDVRGYNMYAEELEEAKAPFATLEKDWLRIKGVDTPRANKTRERLIKKYNLKPLISAVRPGSIKLGPLNDLKAKMGNHTIAGLDADGELIFVTNNPVKIYYPSNTKKRPEGEEMVSESVSLETLRLRKVVELSLGESIENVDSFIAEANIELTMTPSSIQKAYKKYVIERKGVPTYEIYHKTYSDAMQSAKSFAKGSGYEVDEDDWFNQVSSGPRKPSKDKTNRFSILLTKNGKEQKKRLQIQVTNLGTSGRPFELNAYIA